MATQENKYFKQLLIQKLFKQDFAIRMKFVNLNKRKNYISNNMINLLSIK